MLRGGLRLNLSYKGAVSWMFNAGCGDIIFAPLYKLDATGVEFKFFHELENMHLSDDKMDVAFMSFKNTGTYQNRPL